MHHFSGLAPLMVQARTHPEFDMPDKFIQFCHIFSQNVVSEFLQVNN
jgi:hypothetical protein